MKRTAALILAGGASARLGEPKQLVKIGTETLLDRSVRIAAEAACSPIVVVLGASAELIRSGSDLRKVQVVLNENWPEGMASSIRAGVAHLQNVEGVVIMTCDMPAVTSSHIRALAITGEITASQYAGRRGVPTYLPKSMFSELMRLEGDAGARDLLRTAPAIELPDGELDIDTAEDLRIALGAFV